MHAASSGTTRGVPTLRQSSAGSGGVGGGGARLEPLWQNSDNDDASSEPGAFHPGACTDDMTLVELVSFRAQQSQRCRRRRAMRRDADTHAVELVQMVHLKEGCLRQVPLFSRPVLREDGDRAQGRGGTGHRRRPRSDECVFLLRDGVSPECGGGGGGGGGGGEDPEESEVANVLAMAATSADHSTIQAPASQCLDAKHVSTLSLLRAPSSLVRMLLPHQIKGVCFLLRSLCGCVTAAPDGTRMSFTEPINGCILADFMGLGKTLQCVAALSVLFGTPSLQRQLLCARPTMELQVVKQQRQLRVVVLAPNGVCPQWVLELQRWSASMVDMAAKEAAAKSQRQATNRKKRSREEQACRSNADCPVSVAGGISASATRHQVLQAEPSISHIRTCFVDAESGCGGARIQLFVASDHLAAAEAQLLHAQHQTSWAPRSRITPVYLHLVETGGARGSPIGKFERTGGILVMPYTQFRAGAISKDLADVILLDEGHVIRNRNTAIAKALEEVVTNKRIVCTGYPLQNNLDELFHLLSFCSQNRLQDYRLLGSRGRFRDVFQSHIEGMLRIIEGRCSVVLPRNPVGVVQLEDSSCLALTAKELQQCQTGQLRTLLLLSIVHPFMLRRGLKTLTMYAQTRTIVQVVVRPSSRERLAYAKFCEALTGRSGKNGALVLLRALEMSESDDDDDSVVAPEDGGEGEASNISATQQRCGAPNSFRNPGSVLIAAHLLSSMLYQPLPAFARSVLGLAPTVGSSGRGCAGEGSTTSIHSFAADFVRDNMDLFFNSGAGGSPDAHDVVATDRESVSPKIHFLFELLARVKGAGEKSIVFSQYLGMLDEVERVNREVKGGEFTMLRCDGGVSVETRVQRCELFNSGEADVLVFSLHTGCEGLNLIGASLVVSVDPSWNPAVQHESFARAYRLVQRKPVEIVTVSVDGSLDMLMNRRQEQKYALMRAVVDGIASMPAWGCSEQQQQQQQTSSAANPVIPTGEEEEVIRLSDLALFMRSSESIEDASLTPSFAAVSGWDGATVEALPPHSFVGGLLEHETAVSRSSGASGRRGLLALVKLARRVPFDEIPEQVPPLEAFTKDLLLQHSRACGPTSFFTQRENSTMTARDKTRLLIQLARDGIAYDRVKQPLVVRTPRTLSGRVQAPFPPTQRSLTETPGGASIGDDGVSDEFAMDGVL